MKTMICFATLAACVAGCVAPSPPDWAELRAARPRSILVLPPENQTTAVEATYGCLATVSRPLAEKGYYVFPVGVVDQYMKENGLPTTGEMWAVPVDKLNEVFGTDTVLYITVKDYGVQHMLVAGFITVSIEGRLVDARTGLELWRGIGLGQLQLGSGTLFDVVIVPVQVAIATETDQAHDVSELAHRSMLYPAGTGLLYGPYHPKYNEQYQTTLDPLSF
jgi:hypothetical protein